jgi:hypothetical protein
MKNRTVWIVVLSVLLLTQIPYALAAQSSASGAVFGGFLLNPIDGNSYLAKMYQGWSGFWQFKLPYSADPGAGSYLFLFYIFLGHVAYWLGLPLLTVFHAARGLATIAMVWMLSQFWRCLLPDPTEQRFAFLLSVFGSGLGWLAYPILARFTPDFWVAEAYPVLSAYANPHFPLAIAIMLWILVQGVRRKVRERWWAIALASLALGLLLPFTVVIAFAVLALLALWDRLEGEPLDWLGPLLIGLGGCLPVLYELLETRINPQLAAWNAQNATPAPAVLDFAIGFLPALIAAGFGVKSWTRHPTRGVRLVLAWALIGLALTYLPVSLQRRFMVGWMIPISGMAAIGLVALRREHPRASRPVTLAVAVAAVLSPLMVILSAVHAVQTQDPSVYLYPGEPAALAWIAANTPPDALILAAPQSGLLIPAYSGRRVVYGHPFETVQADENKRWIEALYSGSGATVQIQQRIAEIRAGYLLYGPREAKLGPPPVLPGMEKAYGADGFLIYSLGG